MNRIAGIDDTDKFFTVTVYQCYLTRISEGYRNHVVEIKIILLARRSLLRWDANYPGAKHFVHAPLGWYWRFDLQVPRHQVNVLIV